MSRHGPCRKAARSNLAWQRRPCVREADAGPADALIAESGPGFGVSLHGVGRRHASGGFSLSAEAPNALQRLRAQLARLVASSRTIKVDDDP